MYDSEEYVEFLLSRVRAHRQSVAHAFAWPSAAQCAAYALSELGEYTDALLRQQRPRDNRAASRERDAMVEWGQCGYMLASALLLLSSDLTLLSGAVAGARGALGADVGPAQVAAALEPALRDFYRSREPSREFTLSVARAFAAWLAASEELISPLSALRLAEQSIDERVTYHKP